MANILTETCNGLVSKNTSDILTTSRILYLSGEITGQTASSLIQDLMALNIEEPDKEITLYIDSPGGEVSSGMAIYDYIMHMKSPLKTVCIGRAASMGAVLFLAGTTERLIFSHSEIMIHDASFGHIDFGGLKPDEISERTSDLIKICEMLRQIVADRTGRSLAEVIEKMKKDSWFNAEEAVSFGLATGIVGSDCRKEN